MDNNSNIIEQAFIDFSTGKIGRSRALTLTKIEDFTIFREELANRGLLPYMWEPEDKEKWLKETDPIFQEMAENYRKSVENESIRSK